MTPQSAAAPYLTPAEFLARYDARLVGQLMRDDGSAASPAELEADPNLRSILASASGEVEAAAGAGGRYTPAMLQALAGVSLEFLKMLVADLAIVKCRQRRGIADADMPLPQGDEARRSLKALRDGSLIFGLVEVAEATVAANYYFTPADLDRQNLISGWLGGRFLGDRMNRRPRGR